MTTREKEAASVPKLRRLIKLEDESPGLRAGYDRARQLGYIQGQALSNGFKRTDSYLVYDHDFAARLYQTARMFREDYQEISNEESY